MLRYYPQLSLPELTIQVTRHYIRINHPVNQSYHKRGSCGLRREHVTIIMSAKALAVRNHLSECRNECHVNDYSKSTAQCHHVESRAFRS